MKLAVPATLLLTVSLTAVEAQLHTITAGKSTTLGILSGDMCPTRGQASIAGHDILTEQRKLRRYIGYCPKTMHCWIFSRWKSTCSCTRVSKASPRRGLGTSRMRRCRRWTSCPPALSKSH